MCSVPYPSLAQMVERLTVEVKHNYQLVTGSIPVARIFCRDSIVVVQENVALLARVRFPVLACSK